MAINIGPGISIGQGITITRCAQAIGPGNTNSTVTPTLSGSASIGTANGSPFSSSVNSYQFPPPASVPPYGGISTPGVAGFNFGTGNFTVEWFQYEYDTNSYPRIFWYNNGVSFFYWGVSIEAGGNFYFWTGGTPNLLVGSASIGTYKNVWVHFAVVRTSGSMKLYKNGVQIGSTLSVTNSLTATDGAFTVGAKPTGSLTAEQFGGSITSFRVCGVAVYTGNFTTPTSSLAQTQSANPYGGSNTSAITTGQCVLLLNP
jgi:Concanavalin A-like lectin/glucanases superfamily